MASLASDKKRQFKSIKLKQHSRKQQHDNVFPFTNGYVFHCNNKTEKDCIDYSVFGSGYSDLLAMQKNIIPRKTCLFFYNIQRKRFVHGIFVATSFCGRDICRQVEWVRKFPSQVFVKQVYKTNAISGRPPRGKIQALTAKEVRNMISYAGVDVARLNRYINGIGMLEVFPLYKPNPKSNTGEIVIELNFHSLHYNFDRVCKRILRFKLQRNENTLKIVHAYVKSCLEQSNSKASFYLKYEQTNANNNSVTPRLVLEQFTFDYLGWNDNTSPLLHVTISNDSDMLLAKIAINAFNDWNAKKYLGKRLEYSERLLSILSSADSTTMTSHLNGISNNLLKYDTRFKQILDILGWNGISVNVAADNDTQRVKARKATLNYVKKLYGVGNFTASELLRYATIMDNNQDEEERFKINYNSRTKMNEMRIKENMKKTDVSKLANLIASGNGIDRKKLITRNQKKDGKVKLFHEFDDNFMDKKNDEDRQVALNKKNNKKLTKSEKMKEKLSLRRRSSSGSSSSSSSTNGTSTRDSLLALTTSAPNKATKKQQSVAKQTLLKETWRPNGGNLINLFESNKYSNDTDIDPNHQDAPVLLGPNNSLLKQTIPSRIKEPPPGFSNNMLLSKQTAPGKPHRVTSNDGYPSLSTGTTSSGMVDSSDDEIAPVKAYRVTSNDGYPSLISRGKIIEKNTSYDEYPSLLSRGKPSTSRIIDSSDEDSEEEILMMSPKLGSRLPDKNMNKKKLQLTPSPINSGKSQRRNNGMAELTLDGVPLSQEKKSKAKKTLISNNTNNENGKPLTEIQERLQLMKKSAECGFMFLCAPATIRECLYERVNDDDITNGLFGSPMSALDKMREYITDATPLFLGNIHSKEIFGPFFANGRPGKFINPKAFLCGKKSTPFPAQLKVIYDKTIFSRMEMTERYFDNVTNKDRPVLDIDMVNNLFRKLKKDPSFQINENDREREVRQYENPKSLLESHVDVLMNRGQAEINEITENPYLIIDTQNVVFHEDAPTKDALYNNRMDKHADIGKSIRFAIRSLLEAGYHESNIEFILPKKLMILFEQDPSYRQLAQEYAELFTVCAIDEGTKGDDLFLIVRALEIEKDKRGLPVIISNDKFRREKSDDTLIGDKNRRSWFGRWLDKHTFTYNWNRGKLTLNSRTPPPIKFRTHKVLSYVHVYPEVEILRHDCINKVVEKIQSIMLTEYPGKKSKIPNISSLILSNWIFDCSREGTLVNENGSQYQNGAEGWRIMGGDVQQSVRFGVDSLLPKRLDVNKTHFVHRLRIGLGWEFSNAFAEKLYNGVMHIMDNYRKQICNVLDNNHEMRNIRVDKYTSRDNRNRPGREAMRLTYRSKESLHIFRNYYEDLKVAHSKAKIKYDGKTYVYADTDKVKMQTNILDRRIYSMLQRYDTLWKRNSGSQGALPDQVFDVLQKYLKVEGECFASPLNHRLDKFFSAFHDTDACFGSLGSFFSPSNNRLTGSWECNPPFDIESVKNTLVKFRQLLQMAEEVGDILSFALFCPDFETRRSGKIGHSNAIVKELSALMRFQRSKVIVNEQHTYLYGFQHTPHNFTSDTYWKSNQPTSIFLFQSTKAFVTLCDGQVMKARSILQLVQAEFNQLR